MTTNAKHSKPIDHRTRAPAPRDPDGEILRPIYPALRRYAAVIGYNTDEPDDLVQEALARVLAKGSLQDLDNPKAYLRRAIANLAVDRARARGRRSSKQHLLGSQAEACDDYPSDLEPLEQLSPIDRALVYLVDVEGCSFREAAKLVGVSNTAARLRASSARKKLKISLEEQR